MCSIPRSERSPGGGHGNPLQYNCLEKPMDRGAWQATVHGVSKSPTSLKQLSMHPDTETPTRWEKLTLCCPQALKPEGWWCWFRLTSPPINQKNVHKLIMPCLNHYYESPHHTLQVGTCTFEGISLLWSPLPGRAIKLFFSTSPKTLSLRFNLVLGYRGWICLHHGSENIMGSVLMQCSYTLTQCRSKALERKA